MSSLPTTSQTADADLQLQKLQMENLSLRDRIKELQMKAGMHDKQEEPQIAPSSAQVGLAAYPLWNSTAVPIPTVMKCRPRAISGDWIHQKHNKMGCDVAPKPEPTAQIKIREAPRTILLGASSDMAKPLVRAFSNPCIQHTEKNSPAWPQRIKRSREEDSDHKPSGREDVHGPPLLKKIKMTPMAFRPPPSIPANVPSAQVPPMSVRGLFKEQQRQIPPSAVSIDIGPCPFRYLWGSLQLPLRTMSCPFLPALGPARSVALSNLTPAMLQQFAAQFTAILASQQSRANLAHQQSRAARPAQSYMGFPLAQLNQLTQPQLAQLNQLTQGVPLAQLTQRAQPAPNNFQYEIKYSGHPSTVKTEHPPAVATRPPAPAALNPPCLSRCPVLGVVHSAASTRDVITLPTDITLSPQVKAESTHRQASPPPYTVGSLLATLPTTHHLQQGIHLTHPFQARPTACTSHHLRPRHSLFTDPTLASQSGFNLHSLLTHQVKSENFLGITPAAPPREIVKQESFTGVVPIPRSNIGASGSDPNATRAAAAALQALSTGHHTPHQLLAVANLHQAAAGLPVASPPPHAVANLHQACLSSSSPWHHHHHMPALAGLADAAAAASQQIHAPMPTHAAKPSTLSPIRRTLKSGPAHANGGLYCTKCDPPAPFATERKLYLHNYKSHPKKLFPVTCGKKFKQKSHAKRHMTKCLSCKALQAQQLSKQQSQAGNAWGGVPVAHAWPRTVADLAMCPAQGNPLMSSPCVFPSSG